MSLITRRRSLLIVFLSVFIDLVGFGIVLPLLPIYSERFGASGLTIGLIFSSYSLMQFLLAPFWGSLSDRLGRRPILLLSNLGAAGSYVLFAVASVETGPRAIWLLFISRIFAGICGANLSVASAYIADVSPPERRSKSMALIGVAFGLGFALGPALGSFSVQLFGLAGPGWVAASICGANFLFGFLLLGESRRPGTEPVARRPRLAQWSETLRHPTVGVLIGIYFLATFCFAAFESTFPRLLEVRSDDAVRHVGYLFTYCGALALIIQGGLIGRMVQWLGESRLIAFSLALFALGLLLLPWLDPMGWLVFSLGLVASGSALNRPPTFGLISLNSSPEEQGLVLGVAQSAGTLARILAPVAANLMFEVHPALPYMVCALIAFGAGLFAWRSLCRPAQQVTRMEPRQPDRNRTDATDASARLNR